MSEIMSINISVGFVRKKMNKTEKGYRFLDEWPIQMKLR